MSVRESLYQEQKLSKPKVEDVITALLKNETQKDALEFVDYVKSFKMTPQWASANSWAVNYKSKRVCYIKVSETSTGDGRWIVRPSVEYSDSLAFYCQTEGLTDRMLKNVHYCCACGKCAPGKPVEFFGVALQNVCCSPIDFEFHNPDAAALDCARKMIMYRRNEIASR